MNTPGGGAASLRIDDGPLGWRIWRATMAGVRGDGGWEALIYTDSYLVGEATKDLGPFQLFATVAEPLRNVLAPRLAVRTHWHDPGPPPERSKRKIKKEGSRWLALDVDAEIACLISLIIGCRARSGGKARTFSADDPVGRPMYAEHTTPVALVPAYRAPMLPDLANSRFPVHAVTNVLAQYPALGAQDATALVRAARHYATAMWVADNDPELAWLQLVSALETLASQWRVTTVDPMTLFTSHFSEPARIIRDSPGGDQLLATIAPYFTRLIGASQRFEDFVEEYKPDPPWPRPPNGTNATPQVDWNNLRPIVKTIYRHRSELLHNGTPFPADLCTPPVMIDGIPEERPLGVSSTSGNTTWTIDETPIRLHTFAHLTRGTILKWWADRTSTHTAT